MDLNFTGISGKCEIYNKDYVKKSKSKSKQHRNLLTDAKFLNEMLPTHNHTLKQYKDLDNS
jgi:hypothetical protein